MTEPAPRCRDGRCTPLTIAPVSQREAKAFIERHHRHHRPPAGAVFCLAAAAGERIVGVAMVGRPVARMLDDGWTLEVNRTCIAPDAPHGANSLLYARSWKVTRALGYRRLVTYTQAGESGASLRGAGWRVLAERRPNPGWNRPSRPRWNPADPIARTLWEAV